MEDENALTEAQAEELRTSYRNALVTVMGDDSGESRQNAQHLQWAFDSLLFAFSEAGAPLTEKAIREVLPAEVLQLAIHVNWIPYLDEDGEPYPDKQGDVNVHGYGVTQDFYEAFLRLLPVEEYSDYLKKPWAHPTPAELFELVLKDLGWTQPQFIEHMQIENGTQYRLRHYEFKGKKSSEQLFVPYQNSTERIGLETLLSEPPPKARRNQAQADHRRNVLEVIHKYSKKYATLEEEQLKWRRPEVVPHQVRRTDAGKTDASESFNL